MHDYKKGFVKEWTKDNTYLIDEAPFVLGKQDRDPSKLIDYWEAEWGRMRCDPTIDDPNSKLAKRFQLRFRMPL